MEGTCQGKGLPPDALAAALILLGALAYPALARRKLVLHRCVFREITGIPCPTCGLTRSLALAVRGRFFPSLRQHPLGPMVLLLLVGRLATLLGGRGFIHGYTNEWWGNVSERERMALVALILLSWVVRLLLFGRDKGQDEAFWNALQG